MNVTKMYSRVRAPTPKREFVVSYCSSRSNESKQTCYKRRKWKMRGREKII